MKNELTIAVTTFSKRFDFINSLIPQIRKYSDSNIILIINGEKNGEFDEDYRKKVLELCLNFENIYPVFFIETRGLSKMWNTAIINSTTKHLLILNDDIDIRSGDIFTQTLSHIKTNGFGGITKINGSFSHFIVDKDFMSEIGYFDERLLGFGEEDGDITFRVLELGSSINNLSVSNVINIVSDIRHEHIKSGVGKYSNFNREFIYGSKYRPNPNAQLRGMFDSTMDKVLVDVNQYPYEKFYNVNKNKL